MNLQVYNQSLIRRGKIFLGFVINNWDSNLKEMNNDDKNEIILYKTKHKQVGRRHDYRIYKKNHPDTPKDVESILDLGFLVVEKDYPEQISSLPVVLPHMVDKTMYQHG